MLRRGRRLRTITAPGGVGFLSLLARTGGGTDAVAEVDTETFEVSVDAIDEMFEDHFPIVLGTMRWNTERLIQEMLVQPPPPYVPPEDDFEHLIGDRELGIVEKIFLVRRTRAFKNANVNSTARLARQMKEIRVAAGEVIWRPGDRPFGSYFVVKGKLELRWKDSIQRVGPGYVLGGMESLASQPRWNTLVATDPAILLEGSREALIDMFEDDLEAALKFMSMMAGFLLVAWDRRAEQDAGGDTSASPPPSSGGPGSLPAAGVPPP
jgi:CRP-like cAMP-binding protein